MRRVLAACLLSRGIDRLCTISLLTVALGMTALLWALLYLAFGRTI